MTDHVGGIANDSISGGAEADYVAGRGGADTVLGGAGNDVLYGDSMAKASAPKPWGVDVVEKVDAKVTFVTESAGYQNTLGMYVINADGSMTDVQILFANASLSGSGGSLKAGVSSVMTTLLPGQKIGFFIAPNAYAASSAALTASEGHYEFRDSGGKIATVADGADVALYHVDKAGTATTIKTQNGTTLFFLNDGQNADSMGHVRLTPDVETGIVRIGFEDLLNGGDRDFDDVVFTIDVGVTNAKSWQAIDPPKVLENRNDVIKAGDGDDQAWGNTGNDNIAGEKGNDMLDGGSGNDTVSGGAGDDRLYGRSGDDALYGDDGNDVIEASAGNDRIWDGAGNDKVLAGTGRDQVWAGAGDDVYNGNDGFDIIDFSAAKKAMTLDVGRKLAVSDLGSDTVLGFEQFVGTKHGDVMRGDKAGNVLIGGDGHDLLSGFAGNDSLSGDKGNDTVDGGSGNDVLNGGVGEDVLYGRSGDDVLNGDDGNDLLDASSGNDRIADGAGNDTVAGGSGNDVVMAGAGDDKYNGNADFDILDFSGAAKGLVLDVSKKTATSDLGIDYFLGFEQFVGTKFNDTMRGDKNGNVFVGGEGDDWFRGLGGKDVMTGGAGKDTFAFSPKDIWVEKVQMGVDRITDFNIKEDKLDFFEITKNVKDNKFDMVKLEQTESGTMVWAYLRAAGEFQEVVHLDGVKAEQIADSIKDWLIV